MGINRCISSSLFFFESSNLLFANILKLTLRFQRLCCFSCLSPSHNALQRNIFLFIVSILRFLITGLYAVNAVQVRLAHQVLQKVVSRYLRRDNLLISSIKRLAELAKIGREALMNFDIDELGEIMLEAWRLHQELDPYCSNEFVDRLFSFADPYCSGYKLVGAGGGGFALLIAKDADRAKELRQLLEADSSFDVKIYDWNVYLDLEY